jgi:hypothetical protein
MGVCATHIHIARLPAHVRVLRAGRVLASAGFRRAGGFLERGDEVGVPARSRLTFYYDGNRFRVLNGRVRLECRHALLDAGARSGTATVLAVDLRSGLIARLVQGALDVVPDLVVQVLSPATRINDLGARKDAYLVAGARELWLADPQAATVTAMQPDGRQQTVGSGDQLSSPLLPGFILEVARIFLT